MKPSMVLGLELVLPQTPRAISHVRGSGGIILIAQNVRPTVVGEQGVIVSVHCSDNIPEVTNLRRFSFPPGLIGWRHLGGSVDSGGSRGELFFSPWAKDADARGRHSFAFLGPSHGQAEILPYLHHQEVLDVMLCCHECGIDARLAALLRQEGSNGEPASVRLAWLSLPDGEIADSMDLDLRGDDYQFVSSSQVECARRASVLALYAERLERLDVSVLDASTGVVAGELRSMGHSALLVNSVYGVKGRVLMVCGMDGYTLYAFPDLEFIRAEPLPSLAAFPVGDWDGDGSDDVGFCRGDLGPRLFEDSVLATLVVHSLSDGRALHVSRYNTPLTVFGAYAVIPDACDGARVALAVAERATLRVFGAD